MAGASCSEPRLDGRRPMEVSGRAVWSARVAVALAALATFGRGVPYPLVTSWDDGRFLVDFEPVHSVSWSHFVAIVSRAHFEAWQPTHLLSYWLDVPWAGANGPVLHATSLVLFVLALFVVLALFRELGLSLVAATLATLALGLHPVQVEAVTWATGRKEILALGFGAGAFLAHLRSGSSSDRAAWLSRGLFVLAATSKTTVLPLPLVMVAADVLLRGVSLRRALSQQLPEIATAIALGVVVVRIWQGADMIRAGDEGTFGSAPLVAATISHHLATAFVPVSPSPIYPIERSGEFPATVFLGPALLALAYVAAHRARAKRACFALLAFALLIAPVSNVIPVYFQYQDRYLSLPLLPLSFGLGAAVDAARARFSPRLAVGVAAALVVALATRTALYVGEWASEETLWRYATSAYPDALYAWMKLGERRREAGDYAGAIRAYERAVDAAPGVRLPYGALFYAIALSEIDARGIDGVDAMALSTRFMTRIDEPEQLRMLAGEMADQGFRRPVTMALGRSFDIEPIDDDRLEQAALIQHRLHHGWLARFYVRRMTRAPRVPDLEGYASPRAAR